MMFHRICNKKQRVLNPLFSVDIHAVKTVQQIIIKWIVGGKAYWWFFVSLLNNAAICDELPPLP